MKRSPGGIRRSLSVKLGHSLSLMEKYNEWTNDKVLFIIYFIIDEYSQMYN